ncbi:MAG: NYN domain-containing protein [Spirochaetia bacterium]|nr:NYN domain-containing protein [Spirochaetia bacterium]
MKTDKRFAVLIDSDNIASKYITIILDEISKEGIATYKRIYGDWTSPNSGQWKKALLEYSVIPVQQYSYTQGKNSTDSAMIIDAMDILYSGKVDGFCLVSSDSDFTRLAARLREAGMAVLGMGERKTPKPFIAACNQFKYLDMLWKTAQEEDKQNERIKQSDASDVTSNETKGQKDMQASAISTEQKPIIAAIRTIINESSDDDGWLNAAQLGSILVKRYPDFDVRNYGFSKMTAFLASLDTVEIKKVAQRDNGVVVYVKNAKKIHRKNSDKRSPATIFS